MMSAAMTCDSSGGSYLKLIGSILLILEDFSFFLAGLSCFFIGENNFFASDSFIRLRIYFFIASIFYLELIGSSKNS